MFGLFAPAPPVDADEFAWLIACFSWLYRQLDDCDPAKLIGVLGTATVFEGVDGTLTGHALAEALFARVKNLCGMANWPCELVQGEARLPTSIQPGFALKHDRQPPLGLFKIGEGHVTIAYNPDLLATPHRLVATFAHELAHYLLAAKGAPPGGEALMEHATDCAAVYLGFGPFMANAAFNFHQFAAVDESGWEVQASGYLSEAALVTATALSTCLGGGAREPVEAMLKSHLRRPYRKALTAVRQRLPKGASDLAAVDLSEWA